VSGTLRVERLALRYRLSPRHPAPALARADLDRELEDRLPASCAAALAPVVPDGEGLIVIDRLDVGIAMTGGALDGRRLGALCGRAIGRAVAGALAGEQGPGRVARYASWADYWACFLSDLARGAAGERWQYVALPRPSTTPVGAAFRQALERGVSVAGVLAALAERRRLGPVLAAVGEVEAEVLLDAMGPKPGVAPLPVGDVLAALADPEAGRLGRAALALFLAGTLAARCGGEVLVDEAVRAVRQAAAVVVAGRSLPLAAGEGGGGPAALRRRGGDAAEALSELERIEPELAARVLGGAPPAARGVPAGGDGEVTSHGGVFLLLPALAGLDAEGRSTPAGRFLVLVKCLPVESRSSAWYDPALCLAAGMDSAPGLADLRALGSPPPLPSPASPGSPRKTPTWARWAEATLRVFAGRLPRFQQSSPAYLMRNFVLGPARYHLDDEGVTASLPQVPLRLVLRMSGWAGSDHLIPWLPGGRLRLGSEA
jgi:hypothetical protein